MRIIVAICVFNRFDNLKTWLSCWSMANTKDAELIVIHTGDEIDKFRTYCTNHNIQYIKRANVGFDIGTVQDIFRERLKGFPNDWDYLLWCADDTLPMSKDFITPFVEKLQNPECGLSCMQIAKSTAAQIHVRTSGWCIRKETSKKILFPADPVVTKQHCYLFEHRGGDRTLTNQIRSMGLSCEMVAHTKVAPLWDSGYWKRLNRLSEHQKVFGGGRTVGDKVTFIATIYNSYPQIISALLLQTHKNWELILIHDGPCSYSIKSNIDDDPRIKFIETETRVGNWGHSLRRWALEEIRQGRLSDPDYIVISNADNYHVPVYTEYLLKGFKKSHTAVATYCASMIHSYKAWDLIPVKFEKGYIDCAGVMVKREIATEVGWRDTEEHSADWVYFSDIASRYSESNFVKVPGCLLIHNAIMLMIFLSIMFV